MNILSLGEPEFDNKKQDQGSTEKHFCKYIWKETFFKETFSIRKTLILYKMSQKK